MTVPPEVHYRPAEDLSRACGTCSFYDVGHCTMLDSAGNQYGPVAADYTCDKWTAPPAVAVADHNDLLARGRARAAELEPKLAASVRAVLDHYADVAAAAFTQKATDHLAASTLASGGLLAPVRPGYRLIDWAFRGATVAPLAAAGADVTPGMAMVAVYPHPDEAAALAQPDGEEPGLLHCTLAFLGEIDDATLATVQHVIGELAQTEAPVAGKIGGVAVFAAGENGHPQILLPSVPGLAELRHHVTERLAAAGVESPSEHGWLPHITVGYSEAPEVPSLELAGLPVSFTRLTVTRGNVPEHFPLAAGGPLTAAEVPPEPAPWSAPAPGELVDVDALVAAIKAKTDPVRRAVAETLVSQGVGAVGLDFDTTHPLVGKAIAGSSQHIVSIGETTRDNVMRTIAAAHREGLSIPHTAQVIRAGMKEANTARAVTIARTELVGVVNGASLAATQIAGDALGVGYQKTWLTAPGAQYPRHELYEGLDGQTVADDATFDVGGYDLQYPGDPDGPPEEVINCRCTMEYAEAEAGGGGDGGDGGGGGGGGGGLGLLPIGPGAGGAEAVAPAVVEEVAPVVLTSKSTVDDVKLAVAQFEKLTPDDLSRLAAGDKPFMNVVGYAGKPLVEAESRLREIGSTIVANVDRHPAVKAINESRLKAAETRAYNKWRKVSDEAYDVQEKATADWLAANGKSMMSLSDDEYDAMRRASDEAAAKELAAREAAREKLRVAQEAVSGVARQRAAARADAVTEIIGQIRTLGGEVKVLAEEKIPDLPEHLQLDVKAAVDEAVRRLPADWVAASNGDRPLLLGADLERGFYQHYYPTGGTEWEGQAVSRFVASDHGPTVAGHDGVVSTALHELGHRMERIVPALRSYEWTFFHRRTTFGLDPGSSEVAKLADLLPNRGFKDTEITYADKFTDPYVGKSYGADFNSSYELFTMGLQGVFDGEFGIWEGDPELRDFVIGLLATL